MANIKHGSFELNLGFVKLGADLSDDDRQCAWEFYTEVTTRVAVCGKRADPECADFEGELYVESLNSVHSFFQEARVIMRRFPVGRIKSPLQQEHLGVLIDRVLEHVIRPFLEKWQVPYRYWWEYESNPRLPPVARQGEFPRLKSFLAEWSSVRLVMRAVRDELVNQYALVDVHRRH